jgi:hypothetical protein
VTSVGFNTRVTSFKVSQKSSDIMRGLTVLNCMAKRSVTYSDSIPVSLCVCIYVADTERG